MLRAILLLFISTLAVFSIYASAESIGKGASIKELESPPKLDAYERMLTPSQDAQHILAVNPILARQISDPEFAKIAYDEENTSIRNKQLANTWVAVTLGSLILVLTIRLKPWRVVGTSWNKLLKRADTKAKRIALTVLPFSSLIAFFRWKHDYGDLSLSFLLFAISSILCLLIIFTRLEDWIQGRSADCLEK